MAQKSGSKVDKTEFKRLMREEKAKRIESPLAKYNNIGQLTCVVCNQVIKSELFWTAHLNSKGHLQQIEALKSSAKPKAAQKTDESNSFKRPHPMSSQNENDVKKARTESDTSKKLALINQAEEEEEDEDEEGGDQLANKTQKMEITPQPAAIKTVETPKPPTEVTPNPKELPQGFFDDVKQDMKARNVDYNATLENEFAKFKAEIQNEETKNEILADLDDENRDVDRDLEEVDQLIQKWARVEDLHQRKENLVKLRAEKMKIANEKMEKDDSDDDDSDIDLDSVVNLTLRTKNRC